MVVERGVELVGCLSLVFGSGQLVHSLANGLEGGNNGFVIPFLSLLSVQVEMLSLSRVNTRRYFASPDH